jgi:transposase
MCRYALRDDQWDRIKDLLPGRDGSVGMTAHDNRRFVEAVLYRYRAGIPWRDLPERFGDPIKIHTRFSRWAKSGVWKRIFHDLAADADNEYAMIDSTIVRAHQHPRHCSAALCRRFTQFASPPARSHASGSCRGGKRQANPSERTRLGCGPTGRRESNGALHH